MDAIEIDNVIVMSGTLVRHALLRRAIRLRGNDYVLRRVPARRRRKR